VSVSHTYSLRTGSRFISARARAASRASDNALRQVVGPPRLAGGSLERSDPRSRITQLPSGERARPSPGFLSISAMPSRQAPRVRPGLARKILRLGGRSGAFASPVGAPRAAACRRRQRARRRRLLVGETRSCARRGSERPAGRARGLETPPSGRRKVGERRRASPAPRAGAGSGEARRPPCRRRSRARDRRPL
jgi:hypothetical protein